MGLGLKRVCWYVNVLVSLSGGGEWKDLEKQVGLKQIRRYVSVFVSLSKGGGGGTLPVVRPGEKWAPTDTLLGRCLSNLSVRGAGG